MTATQESYALGSDRSPAAVLRFLDHFLPTRTPVAVEYPVPEFADCPRVVFAEERELLHYLGLNPLEPYGLYWDGPSDFGDQAMLFYTRDGHVIFGLAGVSAEPRKRLKELAAFVGATHSVLGFEQRPPETSIEFIALCAAAENAT